MQTWLKITLGVVGISGGVFLYLSLQSTVGLTSNDKNTLNPTTRLVDMSPAIRGIGPGERPWANQYNSKGELSYQFRAANYEPRDAGSVFVSAPVIRFFLGEGKVVQLEGKTGTVYLPAANTAKKKDGLSSPAADLPSRGTIKDVHISVFDSNETTPVLTATMDNVSFDKDTLRIATEAFNDGTRDIPADKVPIVIRGESVDFDGEGLIIRINQQDDANIQSLEVSRGTRLVIKDAGMFSGLAPAADKPPREKSPPEKSPQPKPEPAPANSVVYRGTIKNRVHITQGSTTTADGDTLQIDYHMAGKSGSLGATDSGAGNKSTTQPTTKPATTRPAEEPYVITWDGPLRVVAGAGDPQTPLKQSITTLIGTPEAPAVLAQGDTKATAMAAIFETKGKIATLQGTDARPVILEGDQGSVVRTPLLKYDMNAELVRMFGATVARAAVDSTAAGKEHPMLVTWSREASFQFSRDKLARRIETATLLGDVNVEDPQLLLKAGKLELAFDPDATTPRKSQKPNEPPGTLATGAQLRRVYAEGSVKAAILDPNSKTPANPNVTPGLTGNTLTLLTSRDAAGKLFASRIESSGNVDATDGKQRLQADTLAMDLSPDSRNKSGSANGVPPSAPTGALVGGGMGASRVETLIAEGHVRATNSDKSVATADKMTVHDASGDADVVLEGPNTGVEGENHQPRLSAPLIHFTQADGIARIPVPGTMSGVQKSTKPGEPDTRFNVKWTDSAIYNSKADRIDVKGGPNGDVQFESTQKDGSLATGHSKTLAVLLGNASATKAPAQGDQLMGGKEMRSIELNGAVELQSVLGDDAGKLLRQFTLLAEKVVIARDETFTVPVPGRFLLVDNRADTSPKLRANDAMPSSAGTTALQWKDSLIYSNVSHDITLNGNVIFAHQPLTPETSPDGKVEAPYRLESDRMIATLMPKPSTGASADLQTSQLKSVSALGAVFFQGRGVSVRASELIFDPIANLVTARGQDRVPVEVDDTRGTGSGHFDSARFNLKSGQIEDLTNATGNVGNLKIPGKQPTTPPTNPPPKKK